MNVLVEPVISFQIVLKITIAPITAKIKIIMLKVLFEKMKANIFVKSEGKILTKIVNKTNTPIVIKKLTLLLPPLLLFSFSTLALLKILLRDALKTCTQPASYLSYLIGQFH